MTKGLVIVWGEIKGEVEICETDTLQDVRALILEEFDKDMLPCQDFCFHLNDIRVSEKQERKKHAWNISTISLHSKQERQGGTKRKLESENENQNETPAATAAAAAASALASIAPIHHDSNDIMWDIKYNKFKKFHDEADGDENKVMDSSLITWFRRQKNLLKNNKLDSSQQDRLRRLGINLSFRKKSVSKVNEDNWQSMFEKLREYHQIKGDFNVPGKDRPLGPWVCAQRGLYAQMKSGERDMNLDRIQKLEELGFEWEWPIRGALYKDEEHGEVMMWPKLTNESTNRGSQKIVL